METRIDKTNLERVKRRLGFAGCLTVNALGRKGGLSLLWKRDSGVEIVSYTQGHILAWVEDEFQNSKWLFTMMYEEPDTGKHHVMWDLHFELKPCDSILWLVIGDFNEILFHTENVGGRPRGEKQM